MSRNVTQTTSSGVFKQAGLDQVFRVINQMVGDGVIETYALGGAFAAVFYLEPDTTFDVDIFCVVSGVAADALDALSPIYQYLVAKGHEPDGEAINIYGIPVQFLPVFNPLNDEGVQKAATHPYLNVPVRVMTPEYLVANMLQTGRAKDYTRVARFMEANVFDLNQLREILRRHNLDDKWMNIRLLQKRLAK